MKKILSYMLCGMLLLLGMVACVDEEAVKGGSGNGSDEVKSD